MGKSFVRRSFYVAPPSAQASEEEWEQWMEADNKAARIAKSRFTREHNKSHDIDVDALPETSTRKIQGTYRQTTTLGLGDDGHLEPIEEAKQEVNIDKARAFLDSVHTSGGRKKSAKERRAARRDVRRRGFRG